MNPEELWNRISAGVVKNVLEKLGLGDDDTFNQATKAKGGRKLRGVGYTRASKEQTKKARKQARASRRINRK
jgi:hypothetical protein